MDTSLAAIEKSFPAHQQPRRNSFAVFQELIRKLQDALPPKNRQGLHAVLEESGYMAMPRTATSRGRRALGKPRRASRALAEGMEAERLHDFLDAAALVSDADQFEASPA